MNSSGSGADGNRVEDEIRAVRGGSVFIELGLASKPGTLTVPDCGIELLF